ncbi:MAG: class II glutamine amidotransferase [Myxococcota bacterium]
MSHRDLEAHTTLRIGDVSDTLRHMCRLFGFRSSVLSGIHSSLVAAENALARQSVRHPDGWGVAYYNGGFPHIIRNDKQALDDGLFKEVSAVLSTRTLLAHIRQATVGKVGILNCHPFQHGPWTFAHNGQIANFGTDEDLRHRLHEAVDGRFHPQILGTTDSEVCFYLFLSRLARRVEDIYHEGIRAEVTMDALKETVEMILEMAPEPDPREPNRLTFLLTNGSVMAALRFRRELYLSTYKSRCPERETCHAFEASRCEREVQDGIVKHLIVTSERVSDNPNVWIELQDGDYASVDFGMNFHRGVLSSLSNRSVCQLPLAVTM